MQDQTAALMLPAGQATHALPCTMTEDAGQPWKGASSRRCESNLRPFVLPERRPKGPPRWNLRHHSDSSRAPAVYGCLS